jgi:hypothetical protein
MSKIISGKVEILQEKLHHVDILHFLLLAFNFTDFFKPGFLFGIIGRHAQHFISLSLGH